MTSLSPEDGRWLDAAVRHAQPFLGTTAENPTVGAIIVDAGSQELIARSMTAEGGRPHAETRALDEAGERGRGATLYVTLEPCNHWGRTPPCVEAVIRAGVARVVVGVIDPDSRTAGHGLQRLKAAGVDVVLAEHRPSRELHKGHISRMQRGRPFVTVKLAVSADGKAGLRDTGNVKITGETARRWTHMQRALSNAVMIGAGTAHADNPQLTVRLKGLEQRMPMRVILAGRRPLDSSIDMIANISGHPVMIIAAARNRPVVPAPVQVVEVPGRLGRPELDPALQALGDNGIADLLVEGGPTLIESLLKANLVDRFHLLQSEIEIGPRGVPATLDGNIAARLGAAGFSLVDHALLGADNLRTFERTF